jgi:pyridoxamine 5'-phosphate oxidase
VLPAEISNPLHLLRSDRAIARDRGDPMAEFGCLATADPSGRPHARFMTLREIDDDCVTLWANSTSPKVNQLALNGHYELTTYWPTLARQYRLQGSHEWVGAALVQALYSARPWRAKVWDWLYEEMPESTPVPDRNSFVARFESLSSELERLFGSLDQVGPAPGAGLLRLQVRRVDVQEIDDEQRLHDRRLFVHDGDQWSQLLLVP